MAGWQHAEHAWQHSKLATETLASQRAVDARLQTSEARHMRLRLEWNWSMWIMFGLKELQRWKVLVESLAFRKIDKPCIYNAY